ncbi:NADH-quinone oxidoreductase subunit M [Polyangium sp. 6x1]|uniref:complex I subunit 4 family protein n=1 Tax=Polyangium sp. 6x1 TaxID=3042689 RepID=UPI0024823EDA|nr:NADH-quinone oxidoreductase subunit M [Polyangium sp. 6x1]MDI1445417.1 NADH-quinone oxidoreductase subunit M [Polyangium sp. 6x1]
MNEIPYSSALPFPILSALILVPLLAAAFVRSLKNARHVYSIGLAGAALELVLAVLVVARFERHTSALQLVERVPLFGHFAYHVGVDGISVLFLPLTAVLALLVILHAQVASKERPGHYLAAIFSLQATLMGAFVALDLLLFWAFAALELVPGTLLVRSWGTGPGRHAAARRYAALNAMGVVLVLAGALVLGRVTGGRFSLDALFDMPAPAKAQSLAFWLFVLGFAVRIPLFPFHGWLPPVMAEGPVVGVSVFLVGAKLGVYGLLRFVVPLLPLAAHRHASILAILGVVGMLYGALLALVQTNLRRLVAFACLAHTGAVLVGLAALNVEGLSGALLVTLNVGLSAAGLYFVAGFLHRRLGSTEIDRAARLSHRAPLLSFTFLLVGLSTIGMPGTSGFEAEHLVVVGALGARHGIMAIAVGLGSLLGAAYLLRYFQRAFLAPAAAAPGSAATEVKSTRGKSVRDLGPRELVIAGAVGAIIVGLGLFSHPLLEVVDGSVRAMSTRLEHAKPHTSLVMHGEGAP